MKEKYRKFKERYPHFEFWALILVALIIVVIISFCGGINIGNISLKEGTFKETLTKEPAPLASADTLAIDSVAEEPKVVEPDTTVKHVLIFGDSMTILLARRLADYGWKNGFDVTSITWDGSSTIGWSSSDKLSEAMNRRKPDFIFLSLGGNEIVVGNKEARLKYIQKLVDRFGDIPFVWIGPPLKTDNTDFEDMVKSVIPANAYFRSDLTLEIGPDHIHPTPSGGRVWMDSIMRWMPSSHHPILSEFPDTTGTRWENIYFNAKGERKN